jgi:hypothetical protein
MFFHSQLPVRFLLSLMIVTNMMTNSVSASSLDSTFTDAIVDDRRSGNLRSNAGIEWQLITDGVMGGLSSGQLLLDEYRGKACLRMRGDVSTENNGGFLQIALSFTDIPGSKKDVFDASEYSGIEIEVSGNDETYNIHFRTDALWFPWQSYRASFNADDRWQTIRIPFASLKPYKTTRKFSAEELIRIGVVAIGRDFKADLCLASLRFYRE